MQIPLSTASQLPLHLKALRQQVGLSQADLAAKLQLSQSRLARMENAPERIRVEQLLALLDALGVTMVFTTHHGAEEEEEEEDAEPSTPAKKPGPVMRAKKAPAKKAQW